MDHVAGLDPLVPANELFGLQVPEPAQAHRLEPATSGGERHSQGFRRLLKKREKAGLLTGS